MQEIDLREVDERDSHWTEVMELAKKYGFICHINGDTATLSTNKQQLEYLGEVGYVTIQGQINAEVFEQ